MKSHMISALLVACGVVIGTQALVAHHAGTMFSDEVKEISGTIKEFQFTNPHSWIHLDVKNDDGTVTRWMIEGGTPNTLFRRGFTKDALKAGVEIVVEGYRAKNGANRANGRDLMFPDGRRLFLGSSGTGAPSDGRDPVEK